MKLTRNIFLTIIGLLAISTISCKKSRIPEFENGANVQFIRDLGVVTATPTTNTSFNVSTFSKANPNVVDAFTMNVIEVGNVSSVKIVVDYRKGTTIITQPYKTITTWPLKDGVSLNSLIALFSSQGVTSATVASGDRFQFRAEITLKSGTVITEQAAVLSALPYTITLTYNITN